MSPTYYESTVVRGGARPALHGEVRADVAIIGAGYTGLSAALSLAERGIAVRVLEADRVCSGASGLNGGQVGSGQRRSQGMLERRYGPDHARALWQIAENAKRLIRERIGRFDIACDYKPGIITAAHKPRYAADLAHEADDLRTRYGYDALETLSQSELRQRLGVSVYFGGVQDNGAGHLNPLKFGLGLARAAEAAGAVIHETSRVMRIDETRGAVFTKDGSVTADHIIVACNGYLGDLVPQIAPTIMPIHAYIAVTAPLGAQADALIRDDVAVADTRFVINYFRLTADKRLLFGGGESYWPHVRGDADRLVRPHLLRIFPQLAGTPIDFAWGGTIAITPTRLPHVGRLGQRLYFAQGFSGQGLALAGMTGTVLAETITGATERFDLMAQLDVRRFPGGTALRSPLRVLAMLYGQLRDML